MSGQANKRKHSADVASGYDRGAAAYAKSWDRPHPWMEDARAEFEKRISPGMSLLDIGCGPGHDSNYWTGKGLQTIGVDISSRAIDQARKLNPTLQFRHLDVFDIGSLKKTFDAAWMAYSLLHISQVEAPEAIHSVASVLKPKGVLFVATSLADSTHEAVRSIAGLIDELNREIEVPYTLWSESDLKGLLSRHFQVEWSKTDNPIPGRPNTWSGIMRRL